MSKPGRPANEQRTARLDADRERKRKARAEQYAKRDPAEVAAKAGRAKESAARTAATIERERNAIAARQAAAAAKAAAAVRPVVRFQVPGIVDDANGVSRFTREYAAPSTMNPYEAPLPPRQQPYIPLPPPGCIVTRVPDPLPPGVVRQANGIRTVSRGNTGRSYSPFDIF